MAVPRWLPQAWFLFLISFPWLFVLYLFYANSSAECYGCEIILPVAVLISGAAAGIFRIGKREALGMMTASVLVTVVLFVDDRNWVYGLKYVLKSIFYQFRTMGLLSAAGFLIGWGIGVLVSWAWGKFFPEAYEYVMAQLRLMWVFVTSLVIYVFGIIFNIMDRGVTGYSTLVPRADFFFVTPFILLYVGVLLHAYRLQNAVPA